jgi:nitroimidazol reductase NimA-like FMN-containing flavoprotein (pyridoxamine 5'-phosphate oxidase superfamily)
MIREQSHPRLTKLDRATCLDLLAAGRFGRIVVALPSGKPVIRPVNYVFDHVSQSIVIQTHPGSKLFALLRADEATFEIDGVDHEARTGWSVIATGVVEELTRPFELQRIAALGAEPWVRGADMHVIRIRAYTVTGRRIES